MEVELINAYVEKQRETINEIMAKNIMLDAKLVVTERNLQQVTEVEKALHEYKLKADSLEEQNKAMNQLIENQKKDIIMLQQKEKELQQTIKVTDEQKEKIDLLHKQINKLTLEKEAQRQKAEKMKKKAEEIMADNG